MEQLPHCFSPAGLGGHHGLSVASQQRRLPSWDSFTAPVQVKLLDLQVSKEWAPEDSGSGSLKLRSNTSPLRLLSGHSPCIYPQVQPLPQRCSLGWPSRASFWISQHCKPQSWGSCLLGAFSTLHHPSSTLQLSAPALCLIHPCFRYEVGSC